jgi:hypothetical protein
MAQPNWIKKYLTMKPEVSKIFTDLEKFHDFCRIELLPFDESNLYNRNSSVWNQYYAATNPRRKFNNKQNKYHQKS